MERKENKILNALQAFRAGLLDADNSRNSLDLYQAFDRLYLDYQDGRITGDEVEMRLAALRKAQNNSDTQTVALRANTQQGLREKIMMRNSEALAQKLLDMPRGSWDRRHVEVVQQAISLLGNDRADDLSMSLQRRLSDSIWAANFELADNAESLSSERHSLETMLDALVSHDVEGSYHVEEPQRELATDIKNDVVKAAVSKAQVARLTAQIDAAKRSADALVVSENYLAAAENESRHRQNVLRASYENAATRASVQKAVQAVQRAAADIVSAEFSKIRSAQAAIAKEIATANDEQLKQEAKTAFAKLTGAHITADALAENVDVLRSLAQKLHSNTASTLVNQLNDIASQAHVARSLASFSVDEPSQPLDDDDKTLLEARMMYEQNRMKYEQNAAYADQAADMLKALDSNVAIPDYAVRRRLAPAPSPRASSNARLEKSGAALKQVRALAQSAASNDAGLYAPYAGAESILNAAASLKIADQAAPMTTDIPTFQNKRVRKSNQLMRDIRQLAYLPAVRNDMGFNVPRFKLIEDMADRPLFKRVKFDPHKHDTAEMLPALYNVAGLRLKRSDAPLRKATSASDANASNLEIIKIIESQFDTAMKTRASENISAGAEEKQPNSDVIRASNAVLDWINIRHDGNRLSAGTKARAKSGRTSPMELAANLRSEGQTLPKSVQEKLSPYLGFDISSVKIYTGPVAEMASAAMGAQAFTLGKSIFFGASKLNFDSPEGLGLLAHELLHTTHFDSGDSVNVKEQAAEAMEARVREAFGSPARGFALEKGTTTAQITKAAQNVSKTVAAASDTTLDAESLYDTISEMVLGMLIDDVKTEKSRTGSN